MSVTYRRGGGHAPNCHCPRCRHVRSIRRSLDTVAIGTGLYLALLFTPQQATPELGRAAHALAASGD